MRKDFKRNSNALDEGKALFKEKLKGEETDYPIMLRNTKPKNKSTLKSDSDSFATDSDFVDPTSETNLYTTVSDLVEDSCRCQFK